MHIKHILVVCGREIPTIEIEGTHYVSARSTTDVFKLDWRMQKRLLLLADSVVLYGVIDISTPEMALILSKDSGYSASRSDKEDTIYLRMDRAMMYIARISTAHMRAKGNTKGADDVLAKQLEYAQALHDYETIGIAVNKNHFGQDDLRRKQRMALVHVMNSKTRIESMADRSLLESLIGDMAGELGVPYQPDLVDSAGKAAA